MAKMIPLLTEQKLIQIAEKSNAEAMFYRQCRDKLSDNYVVFFSIPWVGTGPKGNVRDGEIDFLILDINSGFMVVEIKGGGITYRASTDEWYTTNSKGSYLIKNPFIQAKENKYKVLEILKSHPKWNRTGVKKILMAHAVFFPDLQRIDKLVMPQSPSELIGCRSNFDDLSRWIEDVFSYWKSQENTYQPLGGTGVSLAEGIFNRPIEVRPLVASQLADEELIRIHLTDQQAYLLSVLGMRKRASIAGGAGTGKTLLALNKAQKLAESGIRTLLLCYNRPLADHLKLLAGRTTNLLPMSYHQLCSWRIGIVKAETGRDLLHEAQEAYPNDDLYDVHLPYALALSTEFLPERFDAVIIDEGQDFKEEYWMAIELLLAHPQQSYLYIFYDQNQALYTNAKTFPISDDPYVLTINCRNTGYIHNAAYKYYDGIPTIPPAIQGEPIDLIIAPSIPLQAKKLHAIIVKLIQDERVSPENITILIIQEPTIAFYELLKRFPLPFGINWAFETHGVKNSVLIETVKRFKGLESGIIFLWGFDDWDETRNPELIYVALSRAKSRLYLVGREDCCTSVLQHKELQKQNTYDNL